MMGIRPIPKAVRHTPCREHASQHDIELNRAERAEALVSLQNAPSHQQLCLHGHHTLEYKGPGLGP